MSCKITKDDLAGFYGTSQWYQHWTGRIKYTDGIHFLDRNGAGWLVDAIASYQGSPALKSCDYYQFWKLTVKGNTAVLTCEADEGTPPVVTQKIEYTDFPFDIKIWVEGDVMLLPDEH